MAAQKSFAAFQPTAQSSRLPEEAVETTRITTRLAQKVVGRVKMRNGPGKITVETTHFTIRLEKAAVKTTHSTSRLKNEAVKTTHSTSRLKKEVVKTTHSTSRLTIFARDSIKTSSRAGFGLVARCFFRIHITR